MGAPRLHVAMLSLHSSPLGRLGIRDTGGMSVYVRELARALAALGHRVDIFTAAPGPRDPPVRRLGPGVRLVGLESGASAGPLKRTLPPRLSLVLGELERFRRSEGIRYDVVHSHYWLSGTLGMWAGDRWGVPHVVTFHTLGAVKSRLGCGGGEPRARIRGEAELVHRADRIAVPTPREAEHLVHLYGADPGRIARIPCGVNLRRFRPLDRCRARHRLAIPAGRAVVLYVGRFAPLKGVDRLVEAFARSAHRDRARLLVVGGDGPGDPATVRLRELARDLGVDRAVTFAGPVDQADLPVYYGAADVLVLPSLYESFGLVMLEALACGTPVVATRVGAAEALVRPGITGEIADSPSPGALASSIDRVLGREPPPAAAVRATVAHLGWAGAARSAAALYAETLAGTGAPLARACCGCGKG